MPEFSASDDELLSSYLDDEVTAEERALVATRLADEPAFAQRLDELRAASIFAATPVTPVSPGQTTDLIAAALAASTTTAPNVTDLAAASAARTPARWKGALVSAAAAVAALAIAVPVVQNLGDSDADDSGFASADTVDETAATADDNFAADQMQESAEGDDATDDAGDDMADADMADGVMADDADTEAEMADEAAPASQDEANGPTGDDGGGEIDSELVLDLDDRSIEELSEIARVFQALLDAPDATVAYYATSTDFDTTDEALDQAAERWEDQADEEPPVLSTTTVAGTPVGSDLDELYRSAQARTDAFGSCGALVDVLAEQPFDAPVVAIELASITIDGTPATTVVVDLATGEAVILIVVHDECVIELETLVEAP